MARLTRLTVLLMCFGLACYVSPASGETLAVIVNHTQVEQEIGIKTLKRIFLRKDMMNDNAKPWIPVNLPISNDLRQAFSAALFGQTPEELEAYWNIQYFHGINPPTVLTSEEAVLRFVAITPNSIGYVRLKTADARVKVLKKISLASD